MRDTATLTKVEEAFKTYQELFIEAGIGEGEVNPEDLIEYFSGDTPTGDTTTLYDVITHPWLILHEVAELRHLKLRGYEISRHLLWDVKEGVLEAHLVATTLELQMARKHNDRDWISARIKLIPSWLEDPEMSEYLRKNFEDLLKLYTTDT